MGLQSRFVLMDILWYSTWLRFRVICYKCTSVHSYVKVSLLGGGSQRLMFLFLWVRALSPTSATSVSQQQPTRTYEQPWQSLAKTKGKVILPPMVSGSVCPGIRPPSGTRDQFFFLYNENYVQQTFAGFFSTCCPLWREDQSVIYSYKCYWTLVFGLKRTIPTDGRACRRS
jgi:hypothetical protein